MVVAAGFRPSSSIVCVSDCVCVMQVGQGYPHDPPKVKCDTMVYHPNIDLEGNVCLNILRSAEQCMLGQGGIY